LALTPVFNAFSGMFRHVQLDSVDSTNTYVRDAIKAGQLSGSGLVTATRQTAGRGRGSNTWVSDNDKGLWATLFYTDAAFRPFHLVMQTSVAVTDALREFGAPCAIKWPNDVTHGARKICGILAEAFDGHVIVGFGVNLRQAPADFPPGISDRAVSLLALTGRTVSNEVFVERFYAHYSSLNNPEALFAGYQARLGIVGLRMLLDGVPVLVKGVTREGALRVLDSEENDKTVISGGLQW
jgi:BirA family biotin operon repressor/biotin-[acetyl-CoA-carboxylase] ligase